MAHLPAGADAVGRGRGRRAHPPETWPDYASEIGRFTPLRPGGLLGQTFEIEVAAGTGGGRPLFTRGYVTITRLVTPDDPRRARGLFRRARGGHGPLRRERAAAVPPGGEPIVGFDLTTHRGHFMGCGHNRLVLYTPRRARHGSVRREPGTRCPGTSSAPTGWPGVTPSTRSGVRARWCAEHAAPTRASHRMSDDAFVIGGGPNGLAAAIRLARGGRSVTVLEAADAAGGAVRTEELTLPGFHHDTFSSVYPGRRRLAGVRRHAARATRPALGASRRLLRRIRCRTAAPSRSIAASTRPRPRSTLATPGDGERWRDFVAPCSAPSRRSAATMLGGFPPLGGPLRLARRRSGRSRPPASRACSPARRSRSAAGCSRGHGSRAWLYGSAGTATCRRRAPAARSRRPTSTCSATPSAGPARAGGAGRLTDALVGHLRELGGRDPHGRRGRARSSSRGGRVTGVASPDGERLPATHRDRRRHARTRCLRWRATPCAGATAQLLGRYRYGPATVKVDWALDGPIPWADAAVARRRDGPRRRRRGRAARHDRADRARAARRARSCCSASSRSPIRRALPRAGTRPGRTPMRRAAASTGRAELDRHVERIEAQVERFAPGFRERILARHVLAPADLERAQPQPRRRRRRRRQLPPAAGHLPARSGHLAVPHAAARPLPRQRGRVPGGRGSRRSGRPGGAGRTPRSPARSPARASARSSPTWRRRRLSDPLSVPGRRRAGAAPRAGSAAAGSGSCCPRTPSSRRRPSPVRRC